MIDAMRRCLQRGPRGVVCTGNVNHGGPHYGIARDLAPIEWDDDGADYSVTQGDVTLDELLEHLADLAAFARAENFRMFAAVLEREHRFMLAARDIFKREPAAPAAASSGS